MRIRDRDRHSSGGNNNALISKYFRISVRTPWCPHNIGQSGFTDYLAASAIGQAP